MTSHEASTVSPRSEFRRDVLAGLERSPKSLPCKYFYDAQGAALFDQICELSAYYPTRSELAIMRAHVTEMVALIGPRARLVELGSGSSMKTRILLERARDLAAYVPVDISPDYLAQSTASLAREFPNLRVEPVCADYTASFELPKIEGARATIVYFPGSTVGNLPPPEAKQFLKQVASLCRDGGGLLIGFDLKKDPRIIEGAYNDIEGVTAAFNLNLLHRINRELDGDIDVEQFRHRAFYDAAEGRIEMQLVSRVAQRARVAGRIETFGEGESITTEYSYKYSVDEFRALAASAGLKLQRTWMDEGRLFGVQYHAAIQR